jgi:carboxylate-amine ligase
VGDAAVEVARLRRRLARELRTAGLVAACAGMHPLAQRGETKLSSGDRYRAVGDSLRALARREPTMALHVHVGIPDPDDAIRVLNRFRENIPVLVALSANSPFSQGRDSGFSSTRTLLFDGFPRSGPPRAYACYSEYVAAVDDLIGLGAIPDPTFLWWDVRPQPALGTVEVRVMDAQTRPDEIAPLVALIQSLARGELEGTALETPAAPELLEENRFLAARDGLDASLLVPARRRRVPVRELVEELIDVCWPHAMALGCAAPLDQLAWLATQGGASRQRRWASKRGLDSVAPTLARSFAPSASS